MHGWRRRLVELFRPGPLDREAVEELEHHVELAAGRRQEPGISEREARRRALADLGGIASPRQQVADGRTGFALERLARELRWAARVLRRSPGISLVSIATLAIGVGASAILFALVDAVILRPLPYPDPDRLVRIFDTNAEAGVDRAGAASGNLADWRHRAAVFEGVAGYYAMGRTVSVGGDADVLIGAQVTAGFFDLVRVPAAIGRTFTEEETRRAEFNTAAAPVGPDPVVVLSHAMWQQRFGGDTGAVGRTILLERRAFRIVGVMPAGFALPDAAVQLWMPWHVDSGHPRDQHYLGALARIRPGVSIANAEEQLNTVARDLGAEHPDTNRGWGVRLSPLARETVGDLGRALWILLGSVGVVLLVACANVALLSLIRGLDRRGEAAVRLALGASALQLRREIAWEAAWLALLGGIGGTAIAAAGLRLLPALAPELPRVGAIALDGRAIGFIAVITLLAAVVIASPQVWRRTGTSLTLDLSGNAPRASGSRDQHRLRDGIAVMQVAMTVVLMTAAGLFVRSVTNLQATTLGFDPKGVLVAPVFLDSQAYSSGEKTRVYYRTLFERLSALPGVVSVGGATRVPTSALGPDFERPVWPEGATPDRALARPAWVRMATPGYFRTVGLRTTDGRPFDERDAPEAPRVVIVSETLARRLWPGQTAVGKRLVVDYSTAGTFPYEIVGVVGDVRFRGPRSEPLAEIYLPHAQRSYLILNVVVKTAGDPRALIPAVRAAFRDVDPQKPAHGQYALADLIAMTYTRERQMMVILGVFALASTLLAALGVYGVLSQRVRERSREIGIRLAVGGRPSHVTKWVAGWSLRLIALGLAMGFLITRALGSPLESLLFGIRAGDGLTMLVVVGGVAILGLIGVAAPAWRATRINPIDVLRRP
jgi:putative ABC transport system permease protein